MGFKSDDFFVNLKLELPFEAIDTKVPASPVATSALLQIKKSKSFGLTPIHNK